jgi:hypothetical protein
MRLTINNVINLWFGADTPIRQYKIRLNPEMWTACQQVSRNFKAPSGIQTPERYRKSDKVCFAKAVLDILDHETPTVNEEAYQIA